MAFLNVCTLPSKSLNEQSNMKHLCKLKISFSSLNFLQMRFEYGKW